MTLALAATAILWHHRIMQSFALRSDRIRQIILPALFAAALVLSGATGSRAVDPAYQGEMERLAQVLGSLYFLQPLCGFTEQDWRIQMAELIELDQPDQDRRERLSGSFNTGYLAYSRLYRTCTPSAQEAMTRLLTEAATNARDIHSRYAE